MPNTIKYSTSGDTQSLKKGNFFIGVGDVPKGPSSRTNHWQGITPPTSGYTIYINVGSGSTAIMVPENDTKLVEYANGMNNNTNYISNGGNFSSGSLTPFSNTYSSPGGVVQVTSITNDRPYVGSTSRNAMYMNYNGGGIISTTGLLTTGVTYTFSFWAKIISGSSFSISWNNQNGSGDTNAWTSSANLTTGWRRYIQTFTLNASKNNFYFYSRSADTSLAAVITEFQLMTGSTYGGPGLQNATEALRWFSDVSLDEVCVNRDYETIVTDGLSLNIDGGYTPSYPRTGTTWYDLSYSGNNGTLTNGPTYNSSNGGTIVFDGTNDNCPITNQTFNISTGSSFTIEIAYKRNSSTPGPARGLYTMGPGGISNARIYFWFDNNSNGQMSINYFTQSGFDRYIALSSQSLDTDFHHAVQVVNKSTLLMTGYFDGVSKGSGSIESSSTSDTTFRIGGTTSCNATVAFVRIYNRALSSTEVLQNYQAQFPRFLGENIVTSELSLYLDAAYRPSYPTTGTTWYDVSGYGNNGTLINGPTYSSSNGGVIDFDGTDDFVSCNNILNFTYTNPFTTEAWINWDGGVQPNNAGHIIGKTYGNYRTFLLTNTNPGTISFRLGLNIQTTTTTAIISPNTWYHVVSTWDPSTFISKVYINGVESATSTNTNNKWTFQGNNFQIGNSPGESYYFNGKIPIGRIYSKTLSSAEVLQNYNAQKYRFGL